MLALEGEQVRELGAELASGGAQRTPTRTQTRVGVSGLAGLTQRPVIRAGKRRLGNGSLGKSLPQMSLRPSSASIRPLEGVERSWMGSDLRAGPGSAPPWQCGPGKSLPSLGLSVLIWNMGVRMALNW